MLSREIVWHQHVQIKLHVINFTMTALPENVIQNDTSKTGNIVKT